MKVEATMPCEEDFTCKVSYDNFLSAVLNQRLCELQQITLNKSLVDNKKLPHLKQEETNNTLLVQGGPLARHSQHRIVGR